MPWVLINTHTLPPFPSEIWELVDLPPVANILAYGFRVPVPAATPPNWGTIGYFGVAQIVAGELIYSRTQPLSLLGRGSGQGIRLIGTQDQDTVSAQATDLSLALSIHKWIPRTVCDVFALVP